MRLKFYVLKKILANQLKLFVFTVMNVIIVKIH